MNELYKHEDYKIANEEIFSEEIKNIQNIRVNHDAGSTTGDLNELLECVRKDVLELDYNQMHMDYTDHWSFSLAFEYLIKSEEKEITAASQPYNPDAGILNNVYMSINANYKNTIDWLKRNGYWDKVAIMKTAEWSIYEDGFEEQFKSAKSQYQDLTMDEKGIVEIEYMDENRYNCLYKISGDANLKKAKEFIYNYEIREDDNVKYYVIYEPVNGILSNIDEFALKALLNEVNAEVITQ